MINKKILILIGVMIATLLIVGVVIQLVTANAEKKEIIEKSEGFVNNWGNYQDASSEEYLAKIKPFLTEWSFQQESETAESLRSFTERGYEPNSATTNITGPPAVTKDGTTRIVRVPIEQSIVDYKKQSYILVLYWENQDGNQLIDKFYTEEN